MANADSKRIDKYIGGAPDFARPILEKLRKSVHKGCPDCEEAIKWGVPHFLFNGKILCGMAYFKQHVSFGFWQSKQMEDPESLFASGTGKKASMCNAHFHSAKEMPTQRVLIDYVKRAKKLNEDGVKNPKQTKKKTAKKKVVVPRTPAALAKAFQTNKKAKTYFDSLAPSHRRDYLEWIIEAKREDTKTKRIKETIKLLKEGKTRHWKYQPK